MLEDDYAVSVPDRAQPVGHDEHGTAVHERVKCRLHKLLTLRIKCTRRLVEEEHARVGDDGARDCDALLLPTAHLRTPLPTQGVHAQGQGLDKRVAIRLLCCLVDLIVSGALLAIADIVLDADSEEHRLLRYDPKVLA